MFMKEMLWNEQYNLGIEEIDHVHQRLFYLIHKLVRLNETDAGKPVCRETIQFLKKYSLHHFATEERYMQYTGYEGYQVHKSLHDRMRDEMLPALENELEQTSYSQDSVAHFLGVCMGWLAGHILVEDRAMIGKAVNTWIYESETAPVTLAQTAAQVFNMVSRQDAQLVAENYDCNKEVFSDKISLQMSEQFIYYHFQYASSQKETIRAVLGVEEKAVLSMFSAMLGIENQKLDISMRYAALQLFSQLLKMTAVDRKYLEQYQLEKEEFMTYEQFCDTMEDVVLKYRLAYDIGYGLVVLYVTSH